MRGESGGIADDSGYGDMAGVVALILVINKGGARRWKSQLTCANAVGTTFVCESLLARGQEGS